MNTSISNAFNNLINNSGLYSGTSINNVQQLADSINTLGGSPNQNGSFDAMTLNQAIGALQNTVNGSDPHMQADRLELSTLISLGNLMSSDGVGQLTVNGNSLSVVNGPSGQENQPVNGNGGPRPCDHPVEHHYNNGGNNNNCGDASGPEGGNLPVTTFSGPNGFSYTISNASSATEAQLQQQITDGVGGTTQSGSNSTSDSTISGSTIGPTGATININGTNESAAGLSSVTIDGNVWAAGAGTANSNTATYDGVTFHEVSGLPVYNSKLTDTPTSLIYKGTTWTLDNAGTGQNDTTFEGSAYSYGPASGISSKSGPQSVSGNSASSTSTFTINGSLASGVNLTGFTTADGAVWALGGGGGNTGMYDGMLFHEVGNGPPDFTIPSGSPVSMTVKGYTWKLGAPPAGISGVTTQVFDGAAYYNVPSGAIPKGIKITQETQSGTTGNWDDNFADAKTGMQSFQAVWQYYSDKAGGPQGSGTVSGAQAIVNAFKMGTFNFVSGSSDASNAQDLYNAASEYVATYSQSGGPGYIVSGITPNATETFQAAIQDLENYQNTWKASSNNPGGTIQGLKNILAAASGPSGCTLTLASGDSGPLQNLVNDAQVILQGESNNSGDWQLYQQLVSFESDGDTNNAATLGSSGTLSTFISLEEIHEQIQKEFGASGAGSQFVNHTLQLASNAMGSEGTDQYELTCSGITQSSVSCYVQTDLNHRDHQHHDGIYHYYNSANEINSLKTLAGGAGTSDNIILTNMANAGVWNFLSSLDNTADAKKGAVTQSGMNAFMDLFSNATVNTTISGSP